MQVIAYFKFTFLAINSAKPLRRFFMFLVSSPQSFELIHGYSATNNEHTKFYEKLLMEQSKIQSCSQITE